jgi:hypothetical protein
MSGGPYKTPLPSVPEMIDELVAAGRTLDAACAELRNIIRDGAVILLDCHNPPQTNDWLINGALVIIDVIRRKERHAPWLYPAYFSDGVVVLREQFEVAARLAISEKEIIPANRRFVSDDLLVAEAIEGIRTDHWPNAHKAALELAKRAKGASYEAKVRRLGGKIRNKMN